MDIYQAFARLDLEQVRQTTPGRSSIAAVRHWYAEASSAWGRRRWQSARGAKTVSQGALARSLEAIAHCSPAMAALWARPLSEAMKDFEIDRAPHRVAAFLAQVVHESAGLTLLQENLRHAPERLVQLWPKRFCLPPAAPAGREDATRYAHRPEALANLVYAGRMGNGPADSGDGWRYRGRGLLLLTGRSNYTRAAQALGIDLVEDPDLLLLPEHAARSAAWYWSNIDGNPLADQGSEEAFEQITIGIDGGLGCIHERMALWMRARAVLGMA